MWCSACSNTTPMFPIWHQLLLPCLLLYSHSPVWSCELVGDVCRLTSANQNASIVLCRRAARFYFISHDNFDINFKKRWQVCLASCTKCFLKVWNSFFKDWSKSSHWWAVLVRGEERAPACEACRLLTEPERHTARRWQQTPRMQGDRHGKLIFRLWGVCLFPRQLVRSHPSLFIRSESSVASVGPLVYAVLLWNIPVPSRDTNTWS